MGDIIDAEFAEHVDPDVTAEVPIAKRDAQAVVGCKLRLRDGGAIGLVTMELPGGGSVTVKLRALEHAFRFIESAQYDANMPPYPMAPDPYGPPPFVRGRPIRPHRH